ncbi:hypothetical protein [Brevundimonas diminuta]|uniref:hypothetical protein n=1 Tax=Brevundimonas diminuta TaxID=293 RepID=UPI003209BEDF
MIELLNVGSDDHCGCRVEEILVNGVDLYVHYEDGSADAYLDWGDECDPAEVSLPAPTVFLGRAAVLKWASAMTLQAEQGAK